MVYLPKKEIILQVFKKNYLSFLLCMATILLIILSTCFYFDFETNEETSAKRLKATTEVTFDNKTDNWTIAVVDTYEKTAGGHTYTLYGANGRYSTQQGTNGGDPDFDWGTATVANGTDRVAYADSGDTWSWNKSVVRLIVENFRYDYYYTPTADLYINDVYIRTITSFDTNADFNSTGFDSNNPAHYQGGDNYHTYFNVNPRYFVQELYYMKNGAGGDKIADVSCRYGDIFTYNAPNSPYVGYHFTDWRDVNGNSLTTTNEMIGQEEGKHVFYANYGNNTYYVRFNGNGNTGGSMGDQTFIYDQSANLNSNSYTKYGYDFAGWSTLSTGAVLYSNGQSVTNLSSENGGVVNLYAVWTPKTNCVLYFNSNLPSGATASINPTQKNVTFNSTYGTLATGIRTGYTLEGWYTTSACTTKVSTSTKVTSELQTVYAKWKPNTYYVKFNGNGSTEGNMSNQTFTYDTGQSLTANAFKKTGYDFAGWKIDYASCGEFLPSTGVDASGVFVDAAGYSGTKELIPFKNNSGQGIVLTSNYVVCGIYAYNKDGQFIKRCSSYTTEHNIPSGTEYIRIELNDNDLAYSDISKLRVYSKAEKDFLNNENVQNLSSVQGKEVNLYAVWTPAEYTVTFDPNGQGGTVNPTTKSVTYDSTYGDLPIPTRAGYIFIGWYTDKSAGTQVLSTTQVKTADKHVLYAHWQDTWYSYATQPTGNGTSISPYIIDSAEDFAWIAKDIADNGTKSNYYKQTKLIDLSAHYWLPIGSDSNHSFNGLYDGQGFEIKNLNTYFPTNPDTPELQVNVGLFGYTAGSANIRGIVLRNATIKGAHNTGGIIGQATGKTIVKDIAVDNLNITTTMSYIGTIIGKSESTNVTIKNVVVYSATTSHNHRELNSGEATIDSCLVSIQESKKYHDNTGDGFDFTQWVYISGLKMPVPKGLSWLANGGEPLTKEVLESLGFSAYQY